MQFRKLAFAADQRMGRREFGRRGAWLALARFRRRQAIAAPGICANPSVLAAEKLAQFADMDVDIIVDDKSPRPDDAHDFVLGDETPASVD
ncbi:MAG: hypothetical protein V4793_16535 [Paraburkholderia tropica]